MPLPFFKKDPEKEALVKELGGLEEQLIKMFPPALPSPGRGFDPFGVGESKVGAVVEGIMLAPFAILMSPLIIGLAIKEEVFDKRMSKEQLRERIRYLKRALETGRW